MADQNSGAQERRGEEKREAGKHLSATLGCPSQVKTREETAVW